MRFCTLNVHLWSDAAGRSNVDRVIDVLRGLDCDVVALQEELREGAQLARVASALGLHHALGAEAWLGNALLAKRPLEAVEVAPLTVGYEEGRCALIATVRVDRGPLDVCALHLDPHDERTRLRQLARFSEAIARRDPAHLVLGDFNALRLSDYPDDALDAVRVARTRHDREEPRGDVIAQMDALGYVDLLRLMRAATPGAYRDALLTPLPDGARATCWAKTRIDYAWASPAALALRSLVRADIVETDASDHHAVVVEFVPR